VNDNNNIILFPTNRIKNTKNVKHPVDEKEHKKLVEQQTKEFVEGNVDDIAYTLLDKFVNMGIRTNQMTFTADLALVIDSIRGLVYRDFNKSHPAQKLADLMVTLNTSGKNKSARLDYSKVLNVKHKPHKPLSPDIEDEVRDLSDMADIQFTPDFDPEDK
tara:strand:- start:40 stop:519 length:480 start_codon:yes stop_codon:yes gene_type:complete